MSTMDDAFSFCAGRVREMDRDRYLATLFAPADKRPALHALYAFAIEIEAVRHRVTQSLAGEVRLQWWREVLDGASAWDDGGSPVASALRQTLVTHLLPVDPLMAVIDSHSRALFEPPFGDGGALKEFATQTQAGLFATASRILDSTAASDTALNESAGCVHGLSALLRAPGGVTVAPQTVREMAQDEFSTHAGVFGSIAPGIAPAFLVLAVDRQFLARMQAAKDDFAQAAMPEWRRQWTIWRAGKNPKRIAG